VYRQADYLRPVTQTPSNTGIFHGAYTIFSHPFTVTTNVSSKSYCSFSTQCCY